MAKKKEEPCCELCGEDCNMNKEVKKVKRKKPKKDNKQKVKIRFCPKCGNTEVKFVFKLRNIFGILPRMECPKCGYHSPTFPLIEVEKGKIKEVERLILKEPKKGGSKKKIANKK